MATGRKFGWHSGTLTCQDAKVRGDLYVQDDIVFSDVSAGILGITGGIDMQDTTSAIGIDMGGTFSTAAILIDGTCAIGISLDLEYDLSSSADYPKSIFSVQTLTGEDGSDGGGMQGIRSDTDNATYDHSWQVSLQGRATATGAATVGDTIGVYAAIKTVGALTRNATTTSLCAFKGDVSDSPGSSFNANVHGIMIGYASQISYGGKTSLFFGYTHGTAHCDYGLLIDNYSPNMVAGIYLTETTVSPYTPVMTTAISIDAACADAILIASTCSDNAIEITGVATGAGILIDYTIPTATSYALHIDMDTALSSGDVECMVLALTNSASGINNFRAFTSDLTLGASCAGPYAGYFRTDLNGNQVTGLGSALGLELVLGGVTVSSGEFHALTIDIACPASTAGLGSGTGKHSFIKMEIWGDTTAKNNFDDGFNLFYINGVAAGNGSLFSTEPSDSTTGKVNASLRININGTAYWIPLWDAANGQ